MSENTVGKNSNTSRWILIGIIALGVVVIAVGGYLVSSHSAQNSGSDAPVAIVDGAQEFNGITPIDPPRQLHDFTLTNQSNQPTSLSDFKGKMAILFFGYTHCPDYCPGTLLDYKKIKTALGDKADQVAFVFISVDGERDTPKVMADYLVAFDPSFIGLTGDAATLTRLGTDYDLYFQKRASADGSKANYDIDHSTSAYLVDKQQELVAVYTYGTEASDIANDIEKRLG